ncbi:hypothetical protein C9374_000850 [Naegleria lovaniensis]|uniref:Uncharacterized protein n=1 Tax=Naegleria lovaniensis TaxID=51637 RepID=A0AA88KLL6_NAELO|nr:uncharacterized protein C9374_000850 [Naegleria lovaniensis]KAG2388000.1 hypothetical protein C9374_000850 [Naegleria lovaniensis]
MKNQKSADHNKRKRQPSNASESTDRNSSSTTNTSLEPNILSSNNLMPPPPSSKKRKTKKQPEPKNYSNILPFDFYDKLNINGQYVFVLSELERESNYLNDVHRKLLEQLHKLQIEESIMKKHFEAIHHHHQQQEELSEHNEQAVPAAAPPFTSYLAELIGHSSAQHMHHDEFHDTSSNILYAPENIMSTENIKYAPGFNEMELKSGNKRTSTSTSSTHDHVEEYDNEHLGSSNVPEVKSKNFLTLRKMVEESRIFDL